MESYFGLTLDWNLGCSPEERVAIEISAWLPQAFFFFQFPILSFLYVCFVSLIVYVHVYLFSQSKFCLFQNEGVLCENEERKKVDPSSAALSVSRVAPILERSLNILSEIQGHSTGF